jgi:hypothetical protein
LGINAPGHHTKLPKEIAGRSKTDQLFYLKDNRVIDCVIPAQAGIQKCFAEKAGCPPARA